MCTKVENVEWPEGIKLLQTESRYLKNEHKLGEKARGKGERRGKSGERRTEKVQEKGGEHV